MKRLLLMLAAGLLAASCSSSSDGDTPIDNTAFGSEITVDRQTIGSGQNSNFSIPITIAEGATSVKVSWLKDGNKFPEKANNAGVSTILLGWESAGEYSVSCSVKYMFNGKEETKQGPTLTVTVVQSPFQNSLWGDSLEQVKIDNPFIAQSTTAPDPNLYYFMGSDNLEYHYIFKDGKLSQGQIFTSNTSETSSYGGYTFFVENARPEIRLSGESNPTYSYTFSGNYIITTDEQAALDLFKKGLFSVGDNPNEAALLSKMMAENGLQLFVDGKMAGVRSFRVVSLAGDNKLSTTTIFNYLPL